jgi:uncharacterized integral membrane protein (TIGR00697 family)
MKAEEQMAPGGGRPGHAIDTRQKLFVVLAAIFVTCLVLGDVTGGKAFVTPVGPVSVGMWLFPVTFLLTDVVNDYYGRAGARFITLVAAGMAALAWVALVATSALPTDPDSYFQHGEYQKIFGGSAKLFVASILAFLIGQLVDISVFQYWKRLTRARHLWLRATGSTLISQLIDTAVINAIFWGGVADKTPAWIGAKIGREYVIKIVVAVALTPVVYAIHAAIERWLEIQPERHEVTTTRVSEGSGV